MPIEYTLLKGAPYAKEVMEHSADVANMAMMVLDVCGGLACDTELFVIRNLRRVGSEVKP